MKKILLLTAVSVLAIGGLNANAAEVEKQDCRITATILSAFDLSEDQPIQFGNLLAKSDSGYSITIAPNGTVTADSNILVDGKTRSNGMYTLTGTSGHPVTLTTSGSTTLSNGTASMEVSNITLSETSLTIGQTGSVNVTAGATLNVAAKQAVGDYSGTFTITASY